MQIVLSADSENQVHSSQLADGKLHVCCFLQQQFLTVWGGLVCILAFHLNYCISRQVFLQCVLMPGTRPQMQSVVGADSKKDVRCAQLAEREGYRHFLIAFERSSSIQLEGGSMWIPAF